MEKDEAKKRIIELAVEMVNRYRVDGNTVVKAMVDKANQVGAKRTIEAVEELLESNAIAKAYVPTNYAVSCIRRIERQEEDELEGLTEALDEKPKEEPKPRSIQEEIEEEDEFYQDSLKFDELIGDDRGPVEPFDDRLVKNPSFLQTSLYIGKRKTYEENTWISVRREAQSCGTSMHEICRRKGLCYDLLVY